MHNRLAEEAAYFAAVDAGRESAQEEIDRLRAENKELEDALTDIIEACSPPGVPNIHYILKRAKEAVKAKGQGGE